MNNEELKCLLAKFYDGETTEEEEKYLRALFSADLVPEGFETEKDYILFCLANGHMEEPSPMLEENILKAIDASERLTVGPKTNKFLLLTISSAAAVILILIGTYFFIESRSTIRDTYSDPEIAYAETMKILFVVSSRLNKGAQTLQPVSKLSEMTSLSLEKLNESSILINKSIMKLNKLEKVAVDKRISNTGIIVK